MDDFTVLGLFEELEKWGGAIARVTFSDADDNPIRMVIAIDGREECEAIAAALDKLEEEWASE
jgi:hypothetical protein